MKIPMNKFEKKMQSESGVVLITVIILSLVALVTVISILSLNVSQVSVSESEVKNINSEIIAQGAIARAYAALEADPTGATIISPYTDSVVYTNPPATINYTVTTTFINDGMGPNGEGTINVTITY